MSKLSGSAPITLSHGGIVPIIWLARGDFERGWPEHEWRLKCQNLRVLTVNRPRWTGEDLKGRIDPAPCRARIRRYVTIHSLCSQVKRRGGRVLVACPVPLIRLLARCPGVDLVVDWKSPLPDCDVHAPLMSLPAILGTTLTNLPVGIPYLAVDAGMVEHWRPIVAPMLARAEGGSTDDVRCRLGSSKLESPGRGIAVIPTIDGALSRSVTSLVSPNCPASV